MNLISTSLTVKTIEIAINNIIILFNIIKWLKVFKTSLFKTFIINAIGLPFKYIF